MVFAVKIATKVAKIERTHLNAVNKTSRAPFFRYFWDRK